MSYLMAIIDYIKTLFTATPFTVDNTAAYNTVAIVNGKRYYIPAGSSLRYGTGITSDKKTWPDA